ncbi:MAG TPA: hypothetical protein VD858_10705, partial [Reyranella sp.]|nr:hypothetical protein [Reyranella sp.]
GRFNAFSRPAGPAALAACLGIAGLLAGVLIGLGRIAPPPENAPSAAIAFARDAGLAGKRVFNHYGFGGYLISVGIPTFVDGRGELYGGDFIKRQVEAVALRSEEPLEALLDRYAVDWTLLMPEQAANQLLARLPGWRRAYSDEVSTIFVRDK